MAVPVHAQLLVGGDCLDQLDLEGLVLGLVKGDGRVTVPDFGLHRIARVDDLLHLRFDGAKVFGAEGFGAVEIVIPAVLDDRPDGDLHVRPQLLHGAGHDMGQIVADQFQRHRLVLQCVDGDAGIPFDRPLQIEMRAVDRGRHGFLRQTGRDRGRHLGRGHACREVTLVAIGESEGNLGHIGCPRQFGAYETPGCGLYRAVSCARRRPKSTGVGCRWPVRDGQAIDSKSKEPE